MHASHFYYKNKYARSFLKEIINSYLGVKLNHSLLMRRGMLDSWTVLKFIENVILNRNMLIIKQEPVEYHMCFHWINFNQIQCKFK
jgi:hypothetical protein